jgi:hypothetical protein
MEFKEDGVDHINVYSKGKTELGVLLSNFAHTSFTYEGYGKFASVEAFWYYYLTGCKHEHLKNLHGWKAKQEGRKCSQDRIDKCGLTEEHREVIKEAIRCKLRQNRRIVRMMKESSLPFTHYYEYGGKRVCPTEYDWIIDEISRLRQLIKRSKGQS